MNEDGERMIPLLAVFRRLPEFSCASVHWHSFRQAAIAASSHSQPLTVRKDHREPVPHLLTRLSRLMVSYVYRRPAKRISPVMVRKKMRRKSPQTITLVASLDDGSLFCDGSVFADGIMVTNGIMVTSTVGCRPTAHSRRYR